MTISPLSDAPLPDSVLGILQQSPLDPILNTPVDAVFRNFGVPTLPATPNPVTSPDPAQSFAGSDQPLPLPVLPGIDLPTLLKPLTDVASSFGSGNMGTGTSNPTQLLSQVGSVLQTVSQIGSSAAGELSGNWQGQGAQAASNKMQQTQQDNAAIQNQGRQQQSLANEAAQVVADGRRKIGEIMAQLQQRLSQLAPTSNTAAGQSAVLSATNDANGQAAQVVSQTESSLSGLISQMRAAGQPVPVTSAPKDVAADESTPNGKPDSGKSKSGSASKPRQDARQLTDEGQSGHIGGVPDFGPAGGMIGGIAMPPLSAWATTRFAGWRPTSTEGEKDNPKNNAPLLNSASDADATVPPAGPGLMPMGGGGMASAAMASGAGYGGLPAGLRDAQVSARHGDDVVGEIDSGTYEVVGGVEPVAVADEWDFSA